MKRWVLFWALIWVATIGVNATEVSSLDSNENDLVTELEALLRIPSVVGRETHAADFILQRLGPLSAESDSLGNVTLCLGSGEPKRIFAVPLDEPGYVVSRIQDDGYLRLTAVGRGHRGRLWHQFREGQKSWSRPKGGSYRAPSRSSLPTSGDSGGKRTSRSISIRPMSISERSRWLKSSSWESSF